MELRIRRIGSQQSSRIALAVLVGLCSTIGTRVAHAFTPLKDGDRVVFYGDSITEQRLYTRYLQQYVDVRYPDKHIHFFNAGWNGDTAPGALGRFDRDVAVLKPTVITFFFGMNDGHYRAFAPPTADEYRTAMDAMLKRCKDAGIRAIVYTPGAVDYDSRENLRPVNYNETLEKLGDVCRELGKQYGVEVVDVHKPMLDFETARKHADPKFTMIPDGVHPNDGGHLVMTGAMLPALAEPMGALATLDANAESNAVHRDGSAWTITLKLPTQFWVEPSSLEVAQRAGVDAFIRPKLVVKDLPAGTYDLVVNEASTGRATAAQLAQGVPLIVNSANGQLVHDLVHQKEDVFRLAWREIRLPLGDKPGVDAALHALNDADGALTDAIHEAASKSEVVTVVLQPAPSGPNLALHKQYVSSDPNGFNWGIGKLTDGSWVASPEHCFATNDSDVFPKSVTVDLESPQTLTQVAFGVPDFGSTKTVVASVSEDGKTFTDVGQHLFTQQHASRVMLTFAPTKARYVRLTYPDHYPDAVGYTPTFTFTTELEAYGAASPSTEPTAAR